MKWSLFEKGKWKRRLALGLCMVLLLGILPFPEGMFGGVVEIGEMTAEAADPRYHFNFDAATNVDLTGGKYELPAQSKGTVQVKFIPDAAGVGGTVPSGAAIVFDEKTMEDTSVVEVTNIANRDELGFQIIARGPGSTTVSGYITPGDNEPTGTGNTPFSVTIIVPIELNQDRTQSNNPDYYFPLRNNQDEKPNLTLRLKYPGVKHQIALNRVVPSGSAINGYEYDYRGTGLKLTSRNDSVVAVADLGEDQNNGILQAIGAGFAEVMVDTTAKTSSEPTAKPLQVVVPLEFSKTAPAITSSAAISGTAVDVTAYADFTDRLEYGETQIDEEDGTGLLRLYSTAFDPNNTSEATHMSYTLTYQNGGGTVSEELYSLGFMRSMEEATANNVYGASDMLFRIRKAGKYKLTAWMDTIPSDVRSLHQATVNFTVPVHYVTGSSIYMNVGDRYNFYNNTNISSDDLKNYRFVARETDEFENENAVRIDATKGIVTARNLGKITVYAYPVSYDEKGGLDAAIKAGEYFSCTIHVIDTLSMNIDEAEIFVGDTLPLEVFSTNPNVPVKWEVSEDGIISWDDTDSPQVVIKGEKEGEVLFTATQTIGGVEKAVTCRIIVKNTITDIKLEPNQLTLGIGESAGIKATVVKPSAATTTLHWVSSDETIVSIDEPNNRSSFCSVTGKKAGTAIIMAINQDNMVVGSCIVTVTKEPGGITLSETSLTLPYSMGKYQLYATVTPADATDKTVSWKSSNDRIARVDQNGQITFTGTGTVAIIATSNGDPTKQAFCELTITEPVSSLTLDQSSITLEVGNTFRLTYEVLPNNAYDRSVTFTSMDTKVATVNSTGLITAKKAGTTYVTVTTSDGGYSKVCTVIVKQAATTIKLDATGLLLDVGEFYNLEATFNPKTTTETKLRWSSNDTSVAKVDTKGRVTGVGEGTCVITVTTENNLAAFCYVTVNQPVTGVELNYDSVSVDKGKTVRLRATVLPENATNQKVTWTTSNASVAAVSASGNVRGIGGGAAIITCTTEEGGYIAVCMVQVIEKVTSIKLNKSSYKLGLGKKFTLTAKVQNSAATDQTVSWKSSNSKVCSVSSKGVITGKKLGTATITATAKDGSGAEATCEVRVVRQATSLTLNRGLLNMVVGDNATLKTTIRPTNATYKTPTYSSSDTKIAIVDTNGRVTAVGAGTCNITAKAKDSSGLSAVCVVIVRPVVASTAITLSPTQITMGVGGSETISYSLRPVDSTDSVTWSTNNSSVATVGRTSGIVRGVAPGTAVVTAKTTSGRLATVQVTVVGLNYSSLTLEQYDSYLLRVMGVTSGIIWDVDNPDICTVTGGRVRAKKAGTTTVVARVNGAELRCRVTVTDIQQ